MMTGEVLPTSHLDTVRNQPFAHPMPDAAPQLPLRGAHDVEERCRILQRKRNAMSRYSASRQLRELDEALEIFSYDVERLQKLADESRRPPANTEVCAA